MLHHLRWSLLGVSILTFSIPSAALAFPVEAAPVSTARGFLQGGSAVAGIAGTSASNGCNSLSGSATQTAIGAHSVALNWNASVPASKSPHGLILGYIVYRSAKSHDRNATPINFARITGTTFSDCKVEPGKTYYYTARAVDAVGRISKPSNEVRVEIPH